MPDCVRVIRVPIVIAGLCALDDRRQTIVDVGEAPRICTIHWHATWVNGNSFVARELKLLLRHF